MNKPQKNCLNCTSSYFYIDYWTCIYLSGEVKASDKCKIDAFIPRFPVPIEEHKDETIINEGVI